MNPTNLRRMRDVQRLSGNFTTRSYSIAEHCYYTGLLFEDIAEADRVRVSKEEIGWVYRHDLLEVVTGDLLYPVKNMNDVTKNAWDSIEHQIVMMYPELSKYIDEEARKWFSKRAWNLFRTCDSLELYLFCKEERGRGNTISNPDGSIVEFIMLDQLVKSEFKSVKEILRA